MRLLLSCLLIIITFLAPSGAQEMHGGYLVQTAITPESYQITNPQELQSFVIMLPKVTPFKTLPATPNPDPFLTGYTPNFEENILVVATGRDRIEQPPVFQGVEFLSDGTRLVKFSLPERSSPTYPCGWAVYTGVVLPRTDGMTRVVVTTPEPMRESDDFQRADFKRAKFKRL